MDLSVEAICLIPTWIRVINGVRFDQTSHRRFILVKSPPCRWWHACASSFRWLNWGRISVWQLETRLVLFRLHRLVHWNGRICNSHFYHTLKESSGGSLTWVSGKFLQRLGRVAWTRLHSQLGFKFSPEAYDSNLVDPASSHTLVSKIKPCMCKYKRFYTVKLRTAHYISYSLFDNTLLLG